MVASVPVAEQNEGHNGTQRLMASEPTRVEYRTRYRKRSWGCGCASFFFVLTVGIVLALLNISVGIGVSVRVPLTSSNVTVAGTVGDKDKVHSTLPSYTRERVAGNQNFFNNSTTMTIWRAEGIAVVIVGHQETAPAIDLYLGLQ